MVYKEIHTYCMSPSTKPRMKMQLLSGQLGVNSPATNQHQLCHLTFPKPCLGFCCPFDDWPRGVKRSDDKHHLPLSRWRGKHGKGPETSCQVSVGTNPKSRVLNPVSYSQTFQRAMALRKTKSTPL